MTCREFPNTIFLTSLQIFALRRVIIQAAAGGGWCEKFIKHSICFKKRNVKKKR